MRVILFLVCTASLAACSTPKADLPRGEQAYEVIRAPAGGLVEYRIGPLDTIGVNVFREPDLTFEELKVDSTGNIPFPLIGTIRAAGKTAGELSSELAARLGERYLKNPQVSVLVVSSVSQRVTVDGSVTEPGVYEISGGTTLIEALARAKGPTRVADLDEVVVFRTINGQRTGAIFDLRRIRAGISADPAIVGGDVIVVGYSAVKGGFREFLSAAPLLGVFRPF